MANETEMMQEHMEDAKVQMQEARSALAEKLDALSEKVEDGVETVTNTVEKAKEALDLAQHVRCHPWPFLGGSVAAGFAAGMLLPIGGAQASNGWSAGASAASEAGCPGAVLRWFQPELEKLKKLGVALAIDAAAQLVTQAVPEEIRPRVQEIARDITLKLGGEPLH